MLLSDHCRVKSSRRFDCWVWQLMANRAADYENDEEVRKNAVFQSQHRPPASKPVRYDEMLLDGIM